MNIVRDTREKKAPRPVITSLTSISPCEIHLMTKYDNNIANITIKNTINFFIK